MITKQTLNFINAIYLHLNRCLNIKIIKLLFCHIVQLFAYLKYVNMLSCMHSIKEPQHYVPIPFLKHFTIILVVLLWGGGGVCAALIMFFFNILPPLQAVIIVQYQMPNICYYQIFIPENVYDSLSTNKINLTRNANLNCSYTMVVVIQIS